MAHYLAIRFPVCLALNKIDAFEEEVVEGGDGGGLTASGAGLGVSVPGAAPGLVKLGALATRPAPGLGLGPGPGLSTSAPGLGLGPGPGVSRCQGREIIRLCQHQARDRGELAVPVSAFAETWDLLKQAAAAGQGLGASGQGQAQGLGLGLGTAPGPGLETDGKSAVAGGSIISSTPTTAAATTTITTTTTTTTTTMPLLPVVGSVEWIKAETVAARVLRLLLYTYFNY